MITGLLIISSSDTAQRITPNLRSLFSSVTFWGISGFTGNSPLANVNSVYVGAKSGILPLEVAAGVSAGISLTEQNKDNLYNYFVGGTKSDGLYYMAW